MSVRKRRHESGRVTWEVRFRDGARHRSKSFATRKDAEAFQAQVTIAKRTESLQVLDRGKVTLAAFGEKWWVGHAQSRLAESTRHNYANAWNRYVLPSLGDRRLRDITPRIIEEWRNQLETAGVGPATVRKSMAVLQSCLQRAVVWGELNSNPCREVRKPTARRQREVRPLMPAEIDMMLNFLKQEGKHRDATIVAVLGYAGLRPSEALALTWDQVREHTLLVEGSVSFGVMKTTKTRRSRTVRIQQPLRTQLLDWQMRSGSRTGLVFPAHNGSPWSREAQKSWQRRVFRAAAISAGRPDATPYTLRHSFASQLIADGCSVVEVAAELGHAPTMTLDTYAHVFAEMAPRADRSPIKALN